MSAPSVMPETTPLGAHASPNHQQPRKRIERDPSAPRIIHTVHGVGYRYEARVG